ncbi:MAG: sigma-70 family RNA polymerase sigma factor [Bacilli bacterium]|nr:sigma-70 family RNA polymerase sigma factor [Bacilli bacterium]
MQRQEYIRKTIEKYSDMVYRIALTRCANKENAEDIFQEVFLKFSEKMPKFESEEHEKAWFIRVTINLTKNLYNSAWNKKTTALEETIIFETPEESEVFHEVLSLQQNYKTVVYLFYYEGYKVKEISEIMQTSENTIKTWLSRARDELKNKLKGGFEDE